MVRYKLISFIFILLLIPSLVYAGGSGAGLIFSGGGITNPASTLWDSVRGKWNLANETWTDLSGYGNDLTANATPVNADGHFTSANAAADFERGDTDYLYRADTTSLSITGNITLSAWVKLETVGTIYQFIISKESSTTNKSYWMYVDATEQAWCALNYTGVAGGGTIAKGATSLSTGTWYHLACVYNGTDIRVYVNGALDSSADNPKSWTNGIYDGTAQLRLGNDGSSTHYLDGILDDVAIWARDLSSAEISTLYGLGDNFAE
jgi:hypothetical protein